MPLHVSSTCAHHQEVKIALYSLWYHHTYRWPSRARERGGFVNKWAPVHCKLCQDIVLKWMREAVMIRLYPV
jgi:hypothetical protein